MRDNLFLVAAGALWAIAGLYALRSWRLGRKVRASEKVLARVRGGGGRS